MEIDLLFTLIRKEDWKAFSESGIFEPDSLEEQGYIQCFLGSQIQEAANSFFSKENDLLLIVIDPLRLQVPIKHEKEGDQTYPNVYGSFSIDAIIDRIVLRKGKKGDFSVKVKHFD